MKPLIAFDFDGTLYPIAPNDSEQMLMMRNTRGTEDEKAVDDVVYRDSNGLLKHGEFNENYDRYTRGCTMEDVEAVARELADKVDKEEFQGYLELSRKADLVVISCGTIQICEKYLEALGIREAFQECNGKELLFENGKVVGLEYHGIKSYPDKATVLQRYRERHERVYAVGDGPTDIPMLTEADKGFIVDLVGKKKPYPFERYDSTSALLEALDKLISP